MIVIDNLAKTNTEVRQMKLLFMGIMNPLKKYNDSERI